MTEGKSWHEIKDEVEKDVSDLTWVKIAGIGDSAVGKTSIVKSFCEGKFSKKHTETVGVDYGFKLHKAGESEVRISFWDFGGNPAYHAVRKDLYDNCQACLLVYDLSNRASFDNLSEWIHEFTAASKKTKASIVVVGNKSDIFARKVDIRTAESWAKKRGYKHYITSALTGEGIQQMFQDVLSMVMK